MLFIAFVVAAAAAAAAITIIIMFHRDWKRPGLMSGLLALRCAVLRCDAMPYHATAWRTMHPAASVPNPIRRGLVWARVRSAGGNNYSTAAWPRCDRRPAADTGTT